MPARTRRAAATPSGTSSTSKPFTTLVKKEKIVDSDDEKPLGQLLGPVVQHTKTPGGLCQYELHRAELIRRNQEMLEQLGVHAARSELPAVPTAAKKPTSRGVKRARAPRAPQEPVRRSTRLQELPALDLYITHEGKGGKVECGGAAQPSSVLAPVVSEREQLRLPEEQLNLESTAGTEAFGREFLNSLKQLSDKTDPGAVVPSKSSLEYAERLAELTCGEEGACKVVPGRIYGLAVHPSPHEVVVAAGDKDGNLGLWNMDQSIGEDDGVVNYDISNSVLNVLQWHPTRPARLYVTSYDGTVRCLDATTGKLDFIYNVDTLSQPHNFWLQSSCLGQPWCADTMMLGDSDGEVHCVDSRSSKLSWTKQCGLDKKLNSVQLHPSKPYMLTAGNARCSRIWDVRKVCKPVCTLLDSRSVNSAHWSPTGRGIVSVTQANYLRVYQNAEQLSGEVQETAACNVRHDNQTGRYLTVFQAQWDPKHDGAFVVGSMAKPRQIEVYSCNWDKQKPACHRVMSLQDPDFLCSVQSRNAFHPSLDLVVGGNASGRCVVFRKR